MADDKWFIRGVPTDIRRQVTDVAGKRGQTVGRLVTDMLRDALSRLTDEQQTAVSDTVVVRLEDLERRVAALEAEQTEAPPEREGHDGPTFGPGEEIGDAEPPIPATGDEPPKAKESCSPDLANQPLPLKDARGRLTDHGITVLREMDAAGTKAKEIAERFGIAPQNVARLKKAYLGEDARVSP